MLHRNEMNMPDWVSPPGRTILSILEERELTVEQFAHDLGKSVKIAQRIIDGDYSIDRNIANLLSCTLGASEKFWLARELDYRASVLPQENTMVSSSDCFLKLLPVDDMCKYGWINRAQSKEDKLAECLSFFDVSSIAQWQGRYESSFQSATFRRSRKISTCKVSTTAWLRQGEIESENQNVGKWSPQILEKQIPHFRRLTWYKSPSLFLPKLKSLMAEAGVKFSIVRAPRGCTASGAVRVLEDGVPHMQLSFKYLSDDQFWFSFFHEIAHLLLHFHDMPILEQPDSIDDDFENEANNYASQIIVPIKYFDEFLSLGGSRFPIIRFAKKVGVAPGLIVGQLHYRRILKFNQMQHLKRRYRWAN